MGLTRQYLRYAPTEVFGVIGSQKSNLVFLEIRGLRGRYCAVGACEDVIAWDIRTGDKHTVLKGEKSEVTRLARSPDKKHLAVGYNDGIVRVFSLNTGEITVSFSGHKSAVTALQYDQKGVRLVSGGKDTEVIVWDIVNESGLYRLKGHKGLLTQAVFMKNRNVLVTSSKDTFVKFWDLDTQHCFKTLVGHIGEVYDFVLLRDEQRLVTGSSDNHLRVWDITYQDQEIDGEEPAAKRLKPAEKTDGTEEDEVEEEELSILSCQQIGAILRHGQDRVVSMAIDPGENILICHGRDTQVEVFKLPTQEEIKKHLHKREKKIRRKQRQAGLEEEKDIPIEVRLDDEISRLGLFRLTAKLTSADVIMEASDKATIVALLNNNTVESICLSVSEKKPQPTNKRQISLLGHHSDVRSVCFSSDNTAIVTASGECVKIWNRASLQCIRTMACDYALCSLFAPGDRHILIGNKSGKIQIYDVAAGTLLESVEAHEGTLWSLCMAPDKRGIVSGSADHTLKFWNYELVDDQEITSTSKRLTLEHRRTLKMDEDVLCVKYSPDQRLVAASLLDNTVKVFFADTLKFFLSLYGHKLPVLCMDISSDSTLLVTGSADRNIKIWGLDFGDCHKSIFAHDDSIMCIQFVGKTHMFFTGGKDKKVKEWDADNFEHIITLEGHHAEVWCLAVSPSGNFVVSGSHDKSLRLWEKTQEPLVLEEEREMAREKEYEESIAHGGQTVVPGETNTEAMLAGKKTIETVKAAERLMEALDLYKEETDKLIEHQIQCKESGKELPPPDLHPMFMAFGVKTPEMYMLTVVRKIKSSELEEALLVLPFSYVTELLKVLEIFIDHGWQVELTCRCLFFLLRVHHGQITSSKGLLPVVDRLRTKTEDKIRSLRDQIGFNMAGLQFLQRDIEMSEEVLLFADATDRFKEKKKKRKKKAILAI